MRTIWKFPLPLEDYSTINIPENAQILTVQMQQEKPALWVLLDPEAPRVPRDIFIIGTGHKVVDNVGNYIGTFQMADGDLIFHVFEELR